MKKKIYYASDLHLEFGDLIDIPKGDVLILAGDIFVIKHIKKFKNFIKKVSDNFELVFMVCGNHEYYNKGEVTKEYRDIIRDKTPNNFILLENDVVTYRNVDIIGATLWTDFDNANPIAMINAQTRMNDYRVIKNLTPSKTLQMHRKTLKYFKETIDWSRETIIVTHHCPIVEMSGSKGDWEAYASDQREFIENNKNISHWIYGHTHHPIVETVGKTKVMTAPRGYIGYETKAHSFKLDKYFEIDVKEEFY